MSYDFVSTMQRLAERHLKVSSVSFLVLFIVGFGIAMRALYVMGWINQTNQAISHINLSLQELVDMEAAARGYLATEKESFVGNYHAARARKEADLYRLRKLLKGNAAQEARLEQFSVLSSQVEALQNQVVSLAKQGKWDEARKLGASQESIDRMSSARQVTNDMLAEENRLIEERARIAPLLMCFALALFACFCFFKWRYARTLAGTMVECSKYDHLVQENVRLQAVASQREDFLAALAHDLKIPVLGSARIFELLERGSVGELTEQQLALVKELKVSNEAQLRLIDKLLEVYRLEHNGLPVKFDQFNLGDVVRDCGSQFAILASTKSVTVRVTVPDQTIVVDGDRLYLRRVLDNLMDNALKFSPQGGVIDLRLVADDAGNAVVTVADTGAGITEDAMKTLFTKFWQGPTGRNYASSIGIGLYLAKIIVEAHNGKISCTSETGGGATFEVKVPALPLPAVVQSSLSSTSGGVDGGSVV